MTSTTAELPVVNGTGATPHLNAALAAFQAEAPQIIKDREGKIPGKDGKQGYNYSYADLASLTAAAYPVLGRHGLSFFAKPGYTGNQFGIICKLKHSSGEEEEGFYPLPQSGTQQQLGSAITYGRRYSMLMMTGLHPDQDDDGAAASTERQHFAPQSAAEAFESAAPAPPRQQASAPANGSAVRPAQAARPAPAAEGEIDEDAQVFADEVHETRTLAALKDLNTRAREAHKIASLIRNPTTGGTGGLGQYIGWKKGVLEKAEQALIELKAAGDTAGLDAAELEHRLVAACGRGIEDATAEDMRKAAGLILKGAGVAA